MLASSLPPPLLDTRSLSTSSLKCKAFYIVMSFVILWSICWSSIHVHFKNGSEYLTRRTAQLFIPLMKIPLCSLFLRSFFRSLEVFFFNFSFISIYLKVSASNIPKYLYVSFSQGVLIFLDLRVHFLPYFVLLRFSLLAWDIFLCQILTLYHHSSSWRAASTDIPDPLCPRLPIIHRLRLVFRVTSCIII